VDAFFFSFLAKWSYLGLFIVLLAAGLGLPLPEDIPLVASGWLVHKSQGQVDLHLMILTGLAGVMIGDSMLYYMGRRYGTHIMEHRWLRRIAKPWLVEKARQKYLEHGAKILFAARFMPGLRSVLFLTAGTFRVPAWKFLLIDGSAALISVPTWILVAWRFSGDVEKLMRDARMASYVIAAVLLTALAIWILWEYFHNLRGRNGTKALSPSAPMNRTSEDAAGAASNAPAPSADAAKNAVTDRPAADVPQSPGSERPAVMKR
jgi:membrane protein DedA with SNARE-associated domain